MVTVPAILHQRRPELDKYTHKTHVDSFINHQSHLKKKEKEMWPKDIVDNKLSLKTGPHAIEIVDPFFFVSHMQLFDLTEKKIL